MKLLLLQYCENIVVQLLFIHFGYQTWVNCDSIRLQWINFVLLCTHHRDQYVVLLVKGPDSRRSSAEPSEFLRNTDKYCPSITIARTLLLNTSTSFFPYQHTHTHILTRTPERREVWTFHLALLLCWSHLLLASRHYTRQTSFLPTLTLRDGNESRPPSCSASPQAHAHILEHKYPRLYTQTHIHQRTHTNTRQYLFDLKFVAGSCSV